MNFDPISFAMGMNAAKGSGGSSGGGVTVKAVHFSPTGTTDTSVTFKHEMGVVPDVIIVIPTIRGTDINYSSSRHVGVVWCAKRQAADALPFARNNMWKASGSKISMATIYGDNWMDSSSSSNRYIYNVTETSATIQTTLTNVYIPERLTAYCIAGLV